ncbi:uncharacterized protein LOC129600294 [Paramacrobiotus metropolitanus]|uniref:uncharacterized protein LOC129600294 n=1 Tax=Paramacrobiotus metropolitanus TaxID=2943436 RepID=UPI0024465B39|nr:uncharacterized protein LOC129600294 [Paramacrobiotus metropolitanus]
MELPEELTAAENELKQIYAEYHTLKNEEQKKKEAAEAAASKKRVSDVVAEDSSTVLKKLKSSGLLEKLHSESSAPKTQFKRAGNLERRLQNQKTTVPQTLSDSSHVSGDAGDISTNFDSRHGIPPESNSRPPLSGFSARIPKKESFSPPKPRSFYDSSFSSSSNSSVDKAASDRSEPNRERAREMPRDGNGYRPRGWNNNGGGGFRQKMVYVEADRVDEGFMRPLFEKFGPLMRVTSVPQARQAFVLFKVWEDSQRAIQEMNNKVVDGVTLHVTLAPDRRRPDHTSPGIPRRTFSEAGSASEAKPDHRELVTYEEGEIV